MKETIDDYGRSDEKRIDAVRQCVKHDGHLQISNHDMNQLLQLILLIYRFAIDPFVSFISFEPSKLHCDAKFADETVGTY